MKSLAIAALAVLSGCTTPAADPFACVLPLNAAPDQLACCAPWGPSPVQFIEFQKGRK